MIQSTTIAFLSSAFIYFSVCQGDICQINGLSPEDLKNLSYDPPRNELLSEAQDKKAWQTFVETYEIPVGKVQNWYNSIVDKNSADAAAKSFSTEVSPILKTYRIRCRHEKAGSIYPSITGNAEIYSFAHSPASKPSSGYFPSHAE